jgi:hypothetical protein
MNKQVKKLWVKALRSGEYVQTTGRLRGKNNSFCCLGVLCNLHAQAHPETAKRQTLRGKYMGHDGVLPREVMNWAGLSNAIGGRVFIDGLEKVLIAIMIQVRRLNK